MNSGFDFVKKEVFMRFFHRFIGASATVILAMLAFGQPANGEVLFEDDFTTDPTTNNWTLNPDTGVSFSQSGSAVTAEWSEDSRNFVSSSASQTGFSFDMAPQQSVTIRAEFAGQSGEPWIQPLLTDSDGNDSILVSVRNVNNNGFGITAWDSNQSSGGVSEFFSTASENLVGGDRPLGDTGDSTEITIDRDDGISVDYTDASASETLNLVSGLMPPNLNFDNANNMSLEARIRSIQPGTPHRLDIDRVAVEADPIPEPASAGLMGVGLFALLPRRRRQ
jgi:hypothetical protein